MTTDSPADPPADPFADTSAFVAGAQVRWGEQTRRAIANFQVSGETMPMQLIEALAHLKSAAANVNAAVGVVAPRVAEAISRAADEIVAGEMRDQFPVDVFQTGSGTSTNMNMNEVLAHRATEICGEPVHPNDHVNASQSSNDVIPSALRVAAASTIYSGLTPALAGLAGALRAVSARHVDTVKAGRTHLMDAVPMTFGQEVGGWARAVELSIDRLRGLSSRLCELPIGGTAVGTGLNAPPGFGRLVAEQISLAYGIEFSEAADHFEAQGSQDAITETSGVLRSVALSLNKIAGDLRLLGSGPATGLGEIRLPELQAGSSIMPGKVNPVIPEVVQQVAAQVVGNDAAIAFASSLSTLQLSTAVPLVARNLLGSIHLITAATRSLQRCIDGLEVDTETMSSYAENTPAITTALAPLLGYDAVAAIVRRARQEGVTVRALLRSSETTVGPAVIDSLDPLRLARQPREEEAPLDG